MKARAPCPIRLIYPTVFPPVKGHSICVKFNHLLFLSENENDVMRQTERGTTSVGFFEMTSHCSSPPQTGHEAAGPAVGVATSGRALKKGAGAPAHRRVDGRQEKMGETEEEKDNVGKMFEAFIQASSCKETLQAFNVLCTQLDLDPADNGSFYSALKAKVTTWKAKALWSKLDKRMAHKEYGMGQACVGTRVSLRPLYVYLMAVSCWRGRGRAGCLWLGKHQV